MTEYTHKVMYYETDKMQITHHSNYLRFMEEARVAYLDEIGYGYDKMEAEGLVSPVVSVNIQYKKPTTFGDLIKIDVKLKSFSPVKTEFEYVMRLGDDVVCLATSLHCFVDDKGKPISIKHVKPELYELFEKVCGK